MMINYKIIATDIDGTLLDDKHLLSKENEQTIIDVVSKDHYFIMNSGALPKDARKILELTKIGINDKTKWFVGLNGIVIYNFKTDETFINITKNSIDVIKKTVNSFPGVNYDIIDIDDQKFLHFVIKKEDSWYNLMLELYRYLQDDANKLKGFNSLLLIMNKYDETNLTLKNIIYFGDNLNDIPVFENPDVKCIAVKNAIEQIQKLADDITTEKVTGIADYLNK